MTPACRQLLRTPVAETLYFAGEAIYEGTVPGTVEAAFHSGLEVVDASTMGGGISIGHVDGAVKASTMGGDISVRMVGASTSERDVELTSHGGTITLTVPKDFPMDAVHYAGVHQERAEDL